MKREYAEGEKREKRNPPGELLEVGGVRWLYFPSVIRSYFFLPSKLLHLTKEHNVSFLNLENPSVVVLRLTLRAIASLLRAPNVLGVRIIVEATVCCIGNQPLAVGTVVVWRVSEN